MTDLARVAPEGETPVNPYSLLEAVNRSSDTAHTAWLIFIGVMTYLMIAVAGVTHKDLLLETPVSLPILQVDIPLTQFFQFAPIVLVLFHLGLISQLVLLARKTLELDHALRLLETSDKRLHPLRLELHNFFFVQAIAGPHRSAVMSGFLHAMSWLTLVILPVVLILYIQVVFLPYHDVAITWANRGALVVDVLMLVMIGVFLMRAETSFLQAFWRTTASHPLSFLITTGVIGCVTLFSFLIATVPGEALDRFGQQLLGAPQQQEDGRRPRYYSGFMMPFSGIVDQDGSLFGIFRRNLVVTDTDLVSDRDVTPGEPTLQLRGRDLRYAKLDRSDLHQADLTGADLSYASLDGTDLRDAWLQCADINELLLTEDREAAECATARGTDFSRARLSGAWLNGIDARGASFQDARAESASFSYALLAGANLTGARLDKADFTGGAQAAGANFAIATLQGADLRGAKLIGADFRSAMMQAAVLDYARLDGATLQGADLEGASLYQSKANGADLSRSRLVAADLRGTQLWMASPPSSADADLADMADTSLEPMSEEAVEALSENVSQIRSEALRRQIRDKIAGLLDREEMTRWANSADRDAWAGLARTTRSVAAVPAPQPVSASGVAGDGSIDQAMTGYAAPVSYSAQLTSHLTGMMCRSRWSNGAVATGIALRALTPHFAGNLTSISDRLSEPGCAATEGVPKRVVRDIAAAADLARGR